MEEKIKNVPNIITTTRIIGSLILLFIEPFSIAFFIVYVLCGLSDVVDGYIARCMRCDSNTGAALDSVADFILVAVLLIVILPVLPWSLLVLYWIAAIALVRFVSLLIGFARYRVFAFLHTYANKATGFALFCFPFLYFFVGFPISAILLCGIAGLSAVEELGIMATSRTLDRDAKSIFVRNP